MAWNLYQIIFSIVFIFYGISGGIIAARKLKQGLKEIENASETDLLERINNLFVRYNRKKYNSLEEFVSDAKHIKRNALILQGLKVILFVNSVSLIFSGIKTWSGKLDLSFDFIIIGIALFVLPLLLHVNVKLNLRSLNLVNEKFVQEGKNQQVFAIDDPLWFKAFLYALMIFIVLLETYFVLDVLDIF